MYNIKTLCYKFCLLYFNCIIFLYFSALDAESEYLVHEALERLMVGRTVITIAHRLSTIMSADQIAVIDNGQVSEIGSYGQLMEIDNGLFRKLVERQTITR
jgi:ATP-binding cassette subfamily B (MDR/TAP) protein 10